MNIGTLVVKVVGDINDYAESLRKSQQATDSFASRAVSGLSAIGGAVVVAGLTAVATATLAIGAAAWSSAETMDKAYDTIQVQTGATGETLKALQGDFDTVFAKVPTDAQDAADVISALNQKLGQTGPSLDADAVKLLNMTNLLGGDAKTNAELFGRAMQDAGVPLDESGNLLDKLFVASQQSGLGVDSLMQKMVQFGAPMRNMGFDLDTSIALFAKWEKEGVNAELVMGSLRIAAGKFAEAGKPLNEGLAESIEKIKGAKDASEALTIATDIFGSRAAGDMAAAIREGRFDITEMTAALQNSQGAINDTAAATMDWDGKWKIFTNGLTISLAPIGETMRGIAGKAMDMLNAFLARPEVQTFIQDVSDRIADFGNTVQAWMPQVEQGFQAGFQWLSQNQGVIVAALSMIGVAILVFAYTSLAAAIPAITAFVTAAWPVVLVLGLVGIAAYLLYQAWVNNWGGIQEKMAAVWAWLQPIFDQIVLWFQTNIPIAIGILADFWNTTLLPALQNVWSWMSTVLFPFLVDFFNARMAEWNNAIKVLGNYWTETLLPAIRNVWSWMNTVLFPFLNALGDVISGVLGLALTALAGLWQNVVWPAIQRVYEQLNRDLMPIFTALTNWWNSTGQPMAEGIAHWFGEIIANAFSGLNSAIQDATGWLQDLANQLDNLELPDWLTPGSPTPWEIGLGGINQELETLAGTNLPEFNTGLEGQQTPIGAMNASGASMPRLGAGIKPRDGSGGAPVIINIRVDNHPLISASDEKELTAKLGPAILALLKQYKVQLNNG